MKIIDLFSGLGGFSAAFVDRGHDVITVDIEPRFHPTTLADIFDIRSLPVADVVLASPPCQMFSIARRFRGWSAPGVPGCIEAQAAIDLVEHTIWLARDANFFVLENPRSMLRRVIGLPRATVTLCQYGARWMKPTDLWGRFPMDAIRPMCKKGSPCHESAPRGSKSGVQGVRDPAIRAKLPYDLSLALCVAMEDSVQ